MSKKYYSCSRIKDVDAQYKMLLGGRNIGKSYAVKHDVVRECYESGREFIYLRRWDEDIKTKYVEQYLTDLDVSSITNGQYEDVYVWQSKIYLCNYNEQHKPKEKMLIGYAHSLNQAERYKSQIYLKVDYIIYEEFITDKQYLPNEPSQLQEYTSTIYRERRGVVYLIGNTISKLCPYFNEWRLEKVEKMKTHNINVFENSTDVETPEGSTTVVVRVAVEMCGAESILSKMAFGDSASMIVKNTWRQKTVPQVDKEMLRSSDEVYHLYVVADNLCFKMILMTYNGCPYWYVKPQTTDLRTPDTERMITKTASFSPMHTNGFTPLTDTERVAFDLILQNKIYYCSNSCGSDFEQVLKKYRMIKL